MLVYIASARACVHHANKWQISTNIIDNKYSDIPMCLKCLDLPFCAAKKCPPRFSASPSHHQIWVVPQALSNQQSWLRT